MREMTISDLEPGMELAVDLHDKQGNLVFARGTKLTTADIKLLATLKTPVVYIRDAFCEEVADTSLITPELRRETVQCLAGFFNLSAGELLKNREEKNAWLKKIRQIVTEIITDIAAKQDNWASYTVRAMDDCTYNHSVNVCLLSIIIGLAMGYNQGQLEELAVGALLHDIGKAIVPQEILDKPGKLTSAEFELMKYHTAYGYKILHNSNEVSDVSALVALQHHERYNGSGYPYQLYGRQIHPYAQICAIADVFEAMTANRVYRKKMMRKTVLDALRNSGNTQFDPAILEVFLRNAAVYPPGCQVKLSTGEVGYIIRVSNCRPLHPVVRVFKRNNVYLKQPYDIDLWARPSVRITEVVES